MRLNVEISKAEMDSVRALKEKTGARDIKDLINSAITVLEWAVEETEAGHEVAAINHQDNEVRILVMPLLKKVRRQIPASSPAPAWFPPAPRSRTLRQTSDLAAGAPVKADS